MPNIAVALKAEIVRIARKELRADAQSLKKAGAAYRRDIAALKKRIGELERQAKSRGKVAAIPVQRFEEEPGRQVRFSATRLAAQRRKLGLSAADFGTLLGVSSLSVYNWESGKVRPRHAQVQAIAAARKLGKREALEMLEQLRK